MQANARGRNRRRGTPGCETDSKELFDVLGHGKPFEMRVLAAERVLNFLVEAKRRMESRRMSQTDLGRRIGASRSQVCRWLRDESGLNAKSMFLIASGLGYDLLLDWSPIGPDLSIIDGDYCEGESKTVSAELHASRPAVPSEIPFETMAPVPLREVG